MDDLISRKAVADILTNPAYPYEPGIERAVMRLPSVPAVPLDKLCEFLAGTGTCPPIKEIPESCAIARCELCWKYYMTEWMEGLDDGK